MEDGGNKHKVYAFYVLCFTLVHLPIGTASTTVQGTGTGGKRNGNSFGDPITTFEGTETQYWLPKEQLTPIFKHGPFVLSQLAGPANPPPELEQFKYDWVVATEFKIASFPKVIRIEVVDPTTLIAKPAATAPPATDTLTTMRLSFGGNPLAAGEYNVTMLDHKVYVYARRVPAVWKWIGSAHPEQVDIKTEELHLRITSSIANKFDDEKLRVLALHLDTEFLAYNKSKAHGALPEMWYSEKPISDTTKMLLQKPTDF